MQKPKFIQKMIDRKIERSLDKPKYAIKDLCVGEIIYVTNVEYYVGPTFLQSGIKTKFKRIKRFAIFYHDPCHNYLHINSNHTLDSDRHCRTSGQYVVLYDSLRDFDKSMQRYMIKNNLKSTSKLSINEIKEIERIVNENLYPTQEHDLFG